MNQENNNVLCTCLTTFSYLPKDEGGPKWVSVSLCNGNHSLSLSEHKRVVCQQEPSEPNTILIILNQLQARNLSGLCGCAKFQATQTVSPSAKTEADSLCAFFLIITNINVLSKLNKKLKLMFGSINIFPCRFPHVLPSCHTETFQIFKKNMNIRQR